MDIPPGSDESCILDMVWKVLYYSERDLLFIQYRRDVGKVDGEHVKDKYVRIEGGDRDML